VLLRGRELPVPTEARPAAIAEVSS
jgi:hypothetical protein